MKSLGHMFGEQYSSTFAKIFKVYFGLQRIDGNSTPGRDREAKRETNTANV